MRIPVQADGAVRGNQRRILRCKTAADQGVAPNQFDDEDMIDDFGGDDVGEE